MHALKQLSHKQIFLDVLRLYFAPLTGAIRGCRREISVVTRSIERRRQREAAMASRHAENL